MKTALRILMQLCVLGVFLGAGLWLGPGARTAYAQLFPRPAFTTGDFSAIYREAGTSVVIYTTSTCPYCKRARALLDRQGVAYRDYLIDESEEFDRQFIELGGRGVPLLLIGERRIVGYREDTIAESLRLLDPVAARVPPKRG
jgi:mycoredoxin